jgi:K(+)-stimulated pyrophosphate-energized sodium pump
LTGKAFPCHEIPLKAGISIGMLLASVELVIMLFILLFIRHDYSWRSFFRIRIGADA